VPCIRDVWVGGRWRGWRERVGGLTMPVDTGDYLCAQWARQVARAALTIPQAMQTYNGTELDPKLPY